MRVVPVLFALWIALTGCTRSDVVHRALPPEDPTCAQLLDLGRANQEPRRKSDNPALCHLQTHRVPAADAPGLLASGGEGWSELAARQGRDLRQAGRFHLAFVEMSDRGALLLPAQIEAARDHLRAQHSAGRQNYVIAFVHGWRHDATPGDNDVRKFRTLLGYARAALNTRCVIQGSYCDVALTGVFVAWRGRSLAEPILIADGGLNPFNLAVAPTLFDRKRTSDQLGAGEGSVLAQVLDGIGAELRLAPGRVSADKYLIMGHSLGGNMLASLMSERAAAAIARHPVPGLGQEARMLAPPMGDLVVLINPAAEAGKWTALQQAMRDKVGLSRADNQLTASTEDGALDTALYSRLSPWRAMFPMAQRPVYLSITSAGNWSGFETEGRKVEFDSATGVLFPLFKRFQGARTPEEQIAIGHLAPDYAGINKLNGPAIGTTHELSVNASAGQPASFAQSARPTESWCDPATGWLFAVRQDQVDRGWSYGDAWGYGLSADEAEQRVTASANIARGINPASVQWRHSLNLRAQPDRWSVVPGRSPFWNVRALDTAIREHGGYVNYPMWCALNQLVLDDVGTDRRIDPTVDDLRTARRQIEVQAAIDAGTPRAQPNGTLPEKGN